MRATTDGGGSKRRGVADARRSNSFLLFRRLALHEKTTTFNSLPNSQGDALEEHAPLDPGTSKEKASSNSFEGGIVFEWGMGDAADFFLVNQKKGGLALSISVL